MYYGTKTQLTDVNDTEILIGDIVYIHYLETKSKREKIVKDVVVAIDEKNNAITSSGYEILNMDHHVKIHSNDEEYSLSFVVCKDKKEPSEQQRFYDKFNLNINLIAEK